MKKLNTLDMFININKTLIIYKTFELVYSFVVIIIYCDNQKTQTLAKNFINYSCIKYLNIQHYFVREKITKNKI